jgi:phosphoglucomutase
MQVGTARVTRLRDVTLGYDSGTIDNKSTLPSTPESHMLMYDFDNNCSIILRTSGTEPKIKCYSEISSGSSGGSQTEAELRETLVAFVEECIEVMLQPKVNHLVAA